MEALTAASGATQVIRILGRLLVECLCELLANDGTSVKCSPSEVDNNVRIVEEGDARHTIVAVVGADSCETK